MNTKKIRTCSYLLPDPGGEVVRQCLDKIEELEKENALLKKLHCDCWDPKEKECMD